MGITTPGIVRGLTLVTLALGNSRRGAAWSEVTVFTIHAGGNRFIMLYY